MRNKSEKFIELANKRTNRAIKDLRLIANLANPRNYDYSEAQAKKITKALQAELDNVKSAFDSQKGGSCEEFSL
jgi:hypothetical protein